MIAANANARIRTILFWFFLLKKFIRPPFRPLAGAAALRALCLYFTQNPCGNQELSERLRSVKSVSRLYRVS